MIKISKLKNNPNNPRIIKDDNFKKLVKSIREFPKMLALRPIIVDENFVIQGGNMRFKALLEAGFKEIPDEWVKQVTDFTEEELKEFIIKDNIGFGEWDYDALANEWDIEKLEDWGLNLPIFKTDDDIEEEEPDNNLSWFLNVRCSDEEEAQKLYERFIGEGLDVKIIN